MTHPVTSRCDEPVDGGLRALGRAWHDACLTCQHSGEALGEGDFYLHEGAPLSGAALRHTAPLCASCGEPALKARLYRHPPYSPWLHSPRLYLLWVHSLWPHLPWLYLLTMKARLFAMGDAYHRACFRCACCQAEIGERRFVPHDGEP